MAQADPDGILAIWHDIDAEHHDDFERWYAREHLPERLGVPGFRFGRRYVAVDAEPAYFTYYEVDDPSVLAGDAYLQRLNNPTDWTRRIMPHFRNAVRAVCRCPGRFGAYLGSHVLTARFVPPAAAGADAARFADSILAALQADARVAAAQLWLAEDRSATLETRESVLRDGPDGNIAAALLIDFIGADAACAVRRERLVDTALAAAGVAAAPEIGVYRFHCMHLPQTAGSGNLRGK